MAIRHVAKLTALACLLGGPMGSGLYAQTSAGDSGAPNMSGVTDVTPGWKYLLRDDDLVMLQVNQNGAVVTTSLTTMDTSNSKLSGTPQTVTVNNSYPSGAFNPTAGSVASEASGRMYNITTDTIALLSAVDNGSQSPATWSLALVDPTGVQSNIQLNSKFRPGGTVFTQVVMGDFNGDGLADPLVFYASVNGNQTQWGMKAMTAADVTKEGPPREGPEFYDNSGSMPVTGGIVVGDFNGDGRDEIAALGTDYHTVTFYSVDPNTLAIAHITTIPLDPTLPNGGGTFKITMVPGQVALAAGKFRQCGGNGSTCQSTGITNADLVVFGQIDKIQDRNAAHGYSVIPIKVTPGSGSFTATVAPKTNATQDEPFFRFPDYHGASGALAQAAPLALWPQQTDAQLVLGIRTDDGASYILIGSFLPDDGTLDTFDWESETEREYAGTFDRLQNMWVGNFDHLDPDGTTHNATWQIETYEVVSLPLASTVPHINIFNVKVPSPFPPTPDSKPKDWLKDQQQSDNTSGVPLVNPGTPSLGFLAPSDTQGRSLRLGAPTIVRIPAQTQPDLVLAIPPMHIDYVAPQDAALAAANQLKGGCTDDVNTPCIVNLTVMPSLPNSQQQGFASSFNFTSSAYNSSKRSSTTSWGVSTKTSIGESYSFNDGLDSASAKIKDTTKFGHDETVKKTYGTYGGITSSLTATTGLADFLYFTQKAMNVYYYPVLGCDSAGASTCWVDGRKVPMYVQFSVPDQVHYSDVDGLMQDWYQPVHEPGNVLSYPWSVPQLQNGFIDQVTPLTSSSCTAPGSASSSYSTQWSSGHSADSSSGSTSSFSDELSMSSSMGAGISGVDSVSIKDSFSVAINTSLNTLNESATSMSSSKAISVNIPDFSYSATCCGYSFAGYIFGLKNTKNPASEDACTAGQTPEKDGCTAVNDPDHSKPIDVAGTGPLFVGFLADPVPNDHNPKTELTQCSASDSWWEHVYTLPDVALNHPGHWSWSRSQQLATFVGADSSKIIADNYFYLMKGFFISKSGTTNGPALAEASPSDELTLTTRVYNYSLVNTTAPVHVRFYGQLYCSNSGSLCGDSFQIGSDQIIPSIAGFKAQGNEPNWTTASADFLPANYAATKNGNTYMVFWVVVWMQDGNGLVAEMPGHGLTSVPASNMTQITDVPFEKYSNNVGLYGVHQQFYICPTSGCGHSSDGPGATQSGGSLKSIHLSTTPQLLLEQRAKISATLQAAGAIAGPVNIAYYDGNPASGGVLLDVQRIQHMDPGATFAHRTFFTPESCGVHTLYASAWLADSPEMQASTATSVTIDSVGFVQALINSTKAAKITSADLGSNLLALLNTALQAFQQGQMDAGNSALGEYMQQLSVASGGGISALSASQLTGQAGVVLGCGASGFLVSASPSSTTVSAGSEASYALAITPAGGFSGEVSLACLGAPQEIHCAFSSPSVTLSGSGQAGVTVTIATGPSVAGAGMMGVVPSAGSARLKFLLMLLLAAFAAAFLQRARLRQTVLGCLIALMLLGGMSGCGSGSSGNTTTLAPGIYPFTLQATSGKTVRNTLLTLVVK